MKAALKMQTADMPNEQNAAQTLRKCCLITDGNSHRRDLFSKQIGFTHQDLISEALLPQIRTVAMMIAASRHRFDRFSPLEFTDEADWFAARILVLNARAFCLDISLTFMLQTANSRAQTFAKQHNLPFIPAVIRPSIGACRPANMLLMECDLKGEALADVYENTVQLRKTLSEMF